MTPEKLMAQLMKYRITAKASGKPVVTRPDAEFTVPNLVERLPQPVLFMNQKTSPNNLLNTIIEGFKELDYYVRTRVLMQLRSESPYVIFPFFDANEGKGNKQSMNGEIEIEIGFQMANHFASHDKISNGQIPGGKYARLGYYGPLEQIKDYYQKLLNWIAQMDLEIIGEPWVAIGQFQNGIEAHNMLANIGRFVVGVTKPSANTLPAIEIYQFVKSKSEEFPAQDSVVKKHNRSKKRTIHKMKEGEEPVSSNPNPAPSTKSKRKSTSPKKKNS